MSYILKDRFRSLLKTKGYTYRDIARITGIPEQTVRGIAAGNNKKKSHIELLAKALSVDYNYLVNAELVHNTQDIDLATSRIIYNAVTEELEEHNVNCTKTLPDIMKDLCYYLYENKRDKIDYNLFVKGMIAWGLYTGSITRKSDDSNQESTLDE